jgi:hypothetical protein
MSDLTPVMKKALSWIVKNGPRERPPFQVRTIKALVKHRFLARTGQPTAKGLAALGRKAPTSRPRKSSRIQDFEAFKANVEEAGRGRSGRSQRGRTSPVDRFVRANFKDTGRARALIAEQMNADHRDTRRVSRERAWLRNAHAWDEEQRRARAEADSDARTLRRSTRPMSSLPRWIATFDHADGPYITVSGANVGEAAAAARVVGRGRFPHHRLFRVVRRMEM